LFLQVFVWTRDKDLLKMLSPPKSIQGKVGDRICKGQASLFLNKAVWKSIRKLIRTGLPVIHEKTPMVPLHVASSLPCVMIHVL
jgi:hypothetical protein